MITLEQDIIPMNIYDDANRKFLYEKTLTHEETALSQRFKYLKDQLDFAKKRITLLQGQVMSYAERLETATLSPGKYMAGTLEMVERAGDIAAKMNSKNREDEKR